MYRTQSWTGALALALLLAGGITSAQQCATPPSGRVMWLPGDGDYDDRAGYYNGDVSGQVDFVPGMVGEAFAFDHDDDAIYPQVTTDEQLALENTFTWEFWARPTATRPDCEEAQQGNCANVGPLPVVVFPVHGIFDSAAGVGIVVGTNGVCVVEHTNFHVPCLLRFDREITGWTHVAVVMEDRTPRLYLDGELVHTGLPSPLEHAFASRNVIGSGLGFGHYRGDLDEVALYDRALTDAEIQGVFAAGSAGKCLPGCRVERHDDLFERAEVVSTTGLRSDRPDGLFGATDILPEADTLLFRDDAADGFAHAIEWRTSVPVTLHGTALHAMHDSDGGNDRAFRAFRLLARMPGGTYEALYDSAVRVPYPAVGADFRQQRCINLRPRLAQEFRAEFVQDGADSFPGPRVNELDGIGPDLVFADGFESAVE